MSFGMPSEHISSIPTGLSRTDLDKAVTVKPTPPDAIVVAYNKQAYNKPSKNILSRDATAGIKTISDLYPEHEALKAAALVRDEHARTGAIMSLFELPEEYEILAWKQMLSLRSKLLESGGIRKYDIMYVHVRNLLVKKFLWHAKRIAETYFGTLPYRPLSGLNDITSDANIGLMNSVDVFDYTIFQPFESTDSFCKFSRKRIKGAIIDGLRVMQPFSRSVSKIKRDVHEKMVQLSSRLGRHPTDSDFCEAYGSEWWEVLSNQLLHANVYNQAPSITSSSDSSNSGDNNLYNIGEKAEAHVADTAITEDTVEASLRKIQSDHVDDLIRSILGEDSIHYEIIFYYFFFGCNLRRISEAFKQSGRRISIPQVNAYKAEAIRILRGKLDPDQLKYIRK